MRIAIGSDHHGLDRKGTLIAALEASGHMVLDLGAFSAEPVDYPDYARVVGQAVLRDFVEAGVLVCGSGVGAAIAANKVRGVRAAPCADTAAALESRQQLDANVLCLSASALDDGAAVEVTLAWIGAGFSGDEAHVRQVAKLAQLEAGAAQERTTPLRRRRRGERPRARPPRHPRPWHLPERRPSAAPIPAAARVPPAAAPPRRRSPRHPPLPASSGMPSSSPSPRRRSASSSRTTSSTASG